MHSRQAWLTAISLAALAPSYLPADAPEVHEAFVEERRLRLWSAQTKNRDLVYSTYLRIDHREGTDPGSWVYEWSNIAKYFVDRGEAFAAKDEREAARDAFLTAAKFYGIARFPAKTLPGQEDAYRKHLEYYKRAGEYFDPELVVLDIPFDGKGYYAARNAITEPRLFAIISACGPIHDGWNNIYKGVWEIQEALSAAIHIDRDNPEAVRKKMKEFSLVNQGLLNGPDSVKLPTLIVNGDLDDLAPVSDLRLLTDSGRETDLWIMGGDQHCFGQYRSIVMPRMADWLVKKLEAGRN